MKHLYNVLMFTILAAGLWSCEPTEPFVVEGEGLWNVTTMTTRKYENDTLVSAVTRTDSLDQWEFERTGRGFLRMANGAVDTVVWQESIELSRLIIYRKVGPWINALISDRTENAMNLAWEVEGVEGSKLLKTEWEAAIARQ